ACWRRGAEVRYVCGPIAALPEVPVLYNGERLAVSGERFVVVSVVSAKEMAEAALREAEQAHLIILCAAVADFTPKEVSEVKIKKGERLAVSGERLAVELVETPDIAALLGARKKEGQVLVGFALETNNEEANAQHKLASKHLDYIVLNSLQDKGAGFGCDTNKVSIYASDGFKKDVPLLSKQNVAEEIIDLVTSGS
ncbi:MAG: phosphopantothenoylcysteine decarboxylase, partial [Paludibacteraceae bacterium]|nr:phosphopantothenoylcysteine decarboxylase [Paludibacteraceae bacterium]